MHPESAAKVRKTHSTSPRTVLFSPSHLVRSPQVFSPEITPGRRGWTWPHPQRVALRDDYWLAGKWQPEIGRLHKGSHHGDYLGTGLCLLCCFPMCGNSPEVRIKRNGGVFFQTRPLKPWRFSTLYHLRMGTVREQGRPKGKRWAGFNVGYINCKLKCECLNYLFQVNVNQLVLNLVTEVSHRSR